MAPQTNAAFALLTLGQWCRNHGIYEIRDVLAKASCLAEGAESSELLAAALEEASIAADVKIPEPPARPTVEDREEGAEEPHPAKGKRRARVDAGKFRADDPATPEVNEAWAENSGETAPAEEG